MGIIDAVPDWPRIDAVTRADGSGEITINGATYRVQRSTPDETTAAILALAADTATKMGRPVRIMATGPDGRQPLIVQPDGSCTPEEAAADDAGATGAPAQAEPPAARTPLRTRRSTRARTALPPPPPSDQTVRFDRVSAYGPAGAGRTPVPRLTLAPTPAAAAEPTEALDADDSEPAATSVPIPGDAPTLADFMETRPAPPTGPAQQGWQGTVRRVTGGLIRPAAGAVEVRHRESIAAVQRSLSGPRTIVVINPKGGAHKTTATMLIAATFGIYRGGSVVAWDNNETRGTLGWRAMHARHTNTAVDLLRDLERFTDPRSARVGDLDNYVRNQGSAQFDVLASDEDAGASASIDAEAFQSLHGTLSRFYRLLVVDTGNNMRATNWLAAVEAADQLVIVSSVREDTAASAAWLVDGLRKKGFEDKLARAVTVISAPSKQPDAQIARRLHEHFGVITRAVVDVPYDPALTDGGPIVYDALSTSTREAWLHATAAIADGL